MSARDIFGKLFDRFTPREQQKLELEQDIVEFCADGIEAGELIEAFGNGLKRHYGQDNCTEALLYLSLAKNAMERLDNGFQVDASEELENIEAMRRRNDRRMP